MAQNNNIAKQLTAALTAHMTGAMTTLATQICESYNKELETANKALSEAAHKNLDLQQEINEAEQRIADAEQRIAQLTDALAKAGTPAPTPATPAAPTKEKRTKKYGKDAIRHYLYDNIKRLIAKGKNVYLAGPAGTGKSQIAEMIAEDLDLPFYVSSQVTQEYKIEGFVDARGIFNSTPFYKAWTEGGIFVLEEMDASAPDVLVLMNTALANGYMDFPGKGMTYKHKDFRCVATGNTYGSGADQSYTGRQQLDASTLDRFRFVTVNYDERIELACAKGDRELVQFVHDIRTAMTSCGACFSFVISYRGISNVTEDIADGFTIAEAMSMDIVKGVDADNINLLYNNLQFRSNKYAQAFKACGTATAKAA